MALLEMNFKAMSYLNNNINNNENENTDNVEEQDEIKEEDDLTLLQFKKQDGRLLPVLSHNKRYPFPLTEPYYGVVRDKQKDNWGVGEADVPKIKSLPLSLEHFNEMIDDDYGIISASSCQTLLARVMSTVDRDKLKSNATVALHRLSSVVIGVIPPDADSELNAAANSMRLSALSDSISKK